MTTLVRGSKDQDAIDHAVQRWVAEAQPITLGMIDDMEQSIPKLRRAYLALMREASDKTADVFQADERRMAAEQDRLAAELSAHRDRLIAASRNFSLPSEARWCTLTRVETGYFGENTNDTLLSHDRDLLSWSYGGLPVTLNKTYRYLMVVPETGRIGWARVMRTRITKIGRTVRDRPINFLGRFYDVEFSAVWDDGQSANMSVVLNRGELVLSGAFTIDGFEILEIRANGDSAGSKDQFAANKAVIEDALVSRLLAPFKYSANLYGVEASQFVSPMESWWQLRLGSHQGSWFIVATRH